MKAADCWKLVSGLALNFLQLFNYPFVIFTALLSIQEYGSMEVKLRGTKMWIPILAILFATELMKYRSRSCNLIFNYLYFAAFTISHLPFNYSDLSFICIFNFYIKPDICQGSYVRHISIHATVILFNYWSLSQIISSCFHFILTKY